MDNGSAEVFLKMLKKAKSEKEKEDIVKRIYKRGYEMGKIQRQKEVSLALSSLGIIDDALSAPQELI